MNAYFNCINTKALDEKLSKEKFPFSQYLFWDYALSSIDLQQHKNYIIERVLQKGFLSDIYFLLKIYSDNEIISAVKASKTLDKKTILFCSSYFNIPLTELHASSYYS